MAGIGAEVGDVGHARLIDPQRIVQQQPDRRRSAQRLRAVVSVGRGDQGAGLLAGQAHGRGVVRVHDRPRYPGSRDLTGQIVRSAVTVKARQRRQPAADGGRSAAASCCPRTHMSTCTRPASSTSTSRTASKASHARDRAFLTDKLTELRDEYAELEFVLPPGVIHGDFSIGNVVRDSYGNPVLIDLDGFAIGPREWDVVLTAVYYDSFGWHTREEYETFARVYGFDIIAWPGYPVLREIQEFLMVT